MAELKVTKGTHFFRVTKITPRGRPAVDSFARKFVQYGVVRQGSRYMRSALRVFATATENRQEYRFHINQFRDFEQHLEAHYIKGDMVEYDELPVPIPTKVKFTIRPEWKDRELQVPIIGYLSSPELPRAKFVGLQTGQGKSYCSMRAMENDGVRTVITVKPMYIEKWVEDIHRTYDIAIEDILVIRGASHLMAMLLMAENNELDAKIIIISNKTLQNWLKLYEKFMFETLNMGYACIPEDLFKHLGAGIGLIDEVHQDFHFNFKYTLHTNVQKTISLSATFIADDDFLNKMYEIAYPTATRCAAPAYKKYIAATAVIYKLKHPQKMKCKDYGSGAYSHHLFEQSVLRSNELTSNYLGLIKRTLEGSYFRDYKPDQRCLVFAISIEMCTVITDYLSKCYPHLKVKRYVEEDPFSNLMTADIAVSTMQSSGTAVDIPNLTTVVMTTAMSSSQGNVQGLGRLRELKDGTTPEFLYFVCEDIGKHVEYHEKKRVILENRALTYKSISVSGFI